MQKNLRSIQFLRFVAASLVAFWHSIEAVNTHYRGSFSEGLSYVAGLGASGVHIFFVISGFVMLYTSFADATRPFSPSLFFARRFVRIYPIYWLYAALYVLLRSLFPHPHTLTLPQLIGSILLLPGYSSSIIGPGWTLSYEVYFYICFGAIMIFALPLGIIAITLFFIVSIAMRLFLDPQGPVLHILTNPLLVEFLFGAWSAYFIVMGVRVPRIISVAMIVVAVALFGTGLAFGYSRLPSVLVWGLPSALLVSGLVLEEMNGQVHGVVCRLSFLGDSSYSLYLLHVIVIDLAMILMVRLFASAASGLEAIQLCFVLTALCIGIACLAYMLVERNLLALLQVVVKRTTQAPQVPRRTVL